MLKELRVWYLTFQSKENLTKITKSKENKFCFFLCTYNGGGGGDMAGRAEEKLYNYEIRVRIIKQSTKYCKT